MPLDPPNAHPIVVGTGKITPIWAQFMAAVGKKLENSQPWPLPSFSVSGLPDPETYEGCGIYVPDETGGGVWAYSDGTDWRRVSDGDVVS